jgi:hypothetical protein
MQLHRSFAYDPHPFGILVSREAEKTWQILLGAQALVEEPIEEAIADTSQTQYIGT